MAGSIVLRVNRFFPEAGKPRGGVHSLGTSVRARMTSTTKVYGRFAAIGGAAIGLPFASASTIVSSGVQNINQTESVGNPVSYDLFLTPSQVTPFVFKAVWSETLEPEPQSTEGVTLKGATGTSEYVLNTTPFFGGPQDLDAGDTIDGTATFGSSEL